MPVRSVLLLLVVVGFITLSAPASAQTCAGFSDVTNLSAFCTNVQWMKNRAITLGCTATTYCPNDPVSRLQMAAFMNRVGNIVTPNVLDAESSGGAMTLTAENYICQTADVPATTYDRTVVGHADVSFGLTGHQVVVVNVARSDDAGTTWNNTLGSTVVLVAGDDTARRHATTVLVREGHSFGPTSRYAIRVVRGTSTSNESITDWTCHLQVAIRTTAE